MSQPTDATNIFEVIERFGDESRYTPDENRPFSATDAPAGSREKIETLRRRLEMGVPLWHEQDRPDFQGLVGALRPRIDAYYRPA